jgi:hypothetical protein
MILSLKEFIIMKKLIPGQAVLVTWRNQKEPLKGNFISYSASQPNEDFERIMVNMDNGFMCDSNGFHPDCVQAA